MTLIPLDHLDAHPDNANRMSAKLVAKLQRHIEQTGRYPPLIVRPHPETQGRFQILDGHHRAEILRSLGYAEAQCDVWHVDDKQAALLLLTLNRLHGDDDPLRRAALINTLGRSMELPQLARLIPEHADQIRRLLELLHPPPPPAAPPHPDHMPQAVTFFLTASLRTRLMKKLAQICPNRSEALVRLLNLDAEG